MFTTCSACRMNLVVTPTDLRTGQGYVRCGRCNQVFNALLTLSEDLDQDEPGLAATGTTTVPAMEDPGDEEEVLTLDDAAESPAEEPPADEQPTTPADAPDRFGMDVVERQPTGTFETIVLEGDGYLQTEEHVDEKEIDAQLREMARQMDTSHPAIPAENIVLETGAEDRDTGFDVDAALGNPRRSRHNRAWWAVAVVLALALVAQFVHHSRQVLVAQHWLEQPMRSLYGLFGVDLEPAWNLKAYDLRQLGGEALPGTSDRIVLRASIHNRATHSQPPPLIRVTLQDKFGNQLSTKDIAPGEYLRNPPARMVPDQRLDALLVLSDPNRQAGGFALDICLADTGGQLHCSSDR